MVDRLLGRNREASAPPTLTNPPNLDPRDAVWARVQQARNIRRPRTLELVAAMADEFIEIHGDRLFGDDAAVVTGFARIDGHRVVVVGQQKGADTDENIRRNFGMPHPEGYRKAMRAMELAERFHMPIVTFVDVPGAHPGAESEERGIAESIAQSVGLMSRLRTPIITVITGEGGSGGALAIAVADVVIALENAVYSVISPEGCAAILWRTADEAPTAAVAMRMTAAEQQALGVVDIVVSEPGEGAHTDHAETARRLKSVILAQLDQLAHIPIDDARRGSLPALPGVGRVHGDRGDADGDGRATGLRRSPAESLRPAGRWPASSTRDEPPAREEVCRWPTSAPVQSTRPIAPTIERAADHAEIDRLAGDLLPALIAKLAATGLGEIEVREGPWRVRVRRPAAADADRGRRPAERPSRAQPGHAGHGHAPAGFEGHRSAKDGRGSAAHSTNGSNPPLTAVGPGTQDPESGRSSGGGRSESRPTRSVATSPAVGVYQPRSDAKPGTRVRAGDRIGAVDMLGIAQEVVAPVDGIVGATLVEPGRGRRIRAGAGRHRARGRAGRTDVPQDPHREPRRDRPPDPARLPDARGRGGRRLQRGGSRLAAGPARRRGDLHRAGRRQALVPVRPGHDLARRSSPAATRSIPGYGFLSEDEGFAEVVRAHDLTFIGPPSIGPGAVRIEGGDPPAARRPRPADDPGLERHAPRRRACARGGRADRLPGADQAVGRRRRQGHADGPLAARARSVAEGLPVRGAGRVRRRFALPRAVARREPPRRGPGRGRPLRPWRPSRRARLLRPAPPPEDPRGGARRRRSRPPLATDLADAGAPGRRRRRATRTSARWSSSSTTPATPTSSRSTAGSRWSTR